MHFRERERYGANNVVGVNYDLWVIDVNMEKRPIVFSLETLWFCADRDNFCIISARSIVPPIDQKE